MTDVADACPPPLNWDGIVTGPQASCERIPANTQDPSTSLNAGKPSALRSMKKKSATIILIGETGTGKTSFMSLLCNLIKGREPHQLEELHDKVIESGLCDSQSQTTIPTLYSVTASDGFCLQILDTPGLADTQGIRQDDKHRAEIKKAIEELISAIDAVIIVANGTMARLGVPTEYTLNIITTMFPRSILSNIGVVLTNTDRTGVNFKSENLPSELKGSPYWAIQNPLGIMKCRNESEVLKQRNEGYESEDSDDYTDPDSWDKDIARHYRRTRSELNSLFKWIDGRVTKGPQEIIDLFEKTAEIESQIEEALASVSLLAEQNAQWVDISRTLEDKKTIHVILQQKQGIEASIAQSAKTIRWGYQSSENYNTICLAVGCHTNCHSPCDMRFTGGWMLGLRCSAFDWWRICKTCNHKARQHRHYKLRHEEVSGQADESLIQALAAANTEEERLLAVKTSAGKEIAKIKTARDEIQATIHSLVEEYNRLALSKNYVGHIRSAIGLLEIHQHDLRAKKGLDVEKELKLIEDMIEKLKVKLNVVEEEGTNSRNWAVVSGNKALVLYKRAAAKMNI